MNYIERMALEEERAKVRQGGDTPLPVPHWTTTLAGSVQNAKNRYWDHLTADERASLDTARHVLGQIAERERASVAAAETDMMDAAERSPVGQRWLAELEEMTVEEVTAAYRAVITYFGYRMGKAT